VEDLGGDAPVVHRPLTAGLRETVARVIRSARPLPTGPRAAHQPDARPSSYYRLDRPGRDLLTPSALPSVITEKKWDGI